MSSSSVGRLAASSALRELRLHLCQKSSASAGARDFVSKHYSSLKTEQPRLPVLVRECSGMAPRLWARYSFGQERSEDLSGKSADEVMAVLKKLAENKQ